MSDFIGKKRGPWDGEERPLYLAPMSGVTDLPYRLLAKECGADVTITEFTNSTALTREAATSWRRMETHETEVPFIPQIFGGDPGDMATAAEMLAPTADVIDLNFGCPAPKVTNICAGAALMGEPERLVSMVETIVERVDVPVTAKMRLGTGGGRANNSTEICQQLEAVGAPVGNRLLDGVRRPVRELRRLDEAAGVHERERRRAALETTGSLLHVSISTHHSLLICGNSSSRLPKEA